MKETGKIGVDEGNKERKDQRKVKWKNMARTTVVEKGENKGRKKRRY